MKHRVSKRKFNRNTKERKALFYSLTTSLIEKGYLTTTLAKAKTIKSLVEKLITKAKEGSLASRRKIHSFLRKRDLVNRLTDEIAPLFKTRKGGYLRIVRLPFREGDGAQMARLEFVEETRILRKETRENNDEVKKMKEKKSKKDKNDKQDKFHKKK